MAGVLRRSADSFLNLVEDCRLGQTSTLVASLKVSPNIQISHAILQEAAATLQHLWLTDAPRGFPLPVQGTIE
jgi:hypothetical protein